MRVGAGGALKTTTSAAGEVGWVGFGHRSFCIPAGLGRGFPFATYAESAWVALEPGAVAAGYVPESGSLSSRIFPASSAVADGVEAIVGAEPTSDAGVTSCCRCSPSPLGTRTGVRRGRRKLGGAAHLASPFLRVACLHTIYLAVPLHRGDPP